MKELVLDILVPIVVFGTALGLLFLLCRYDPFIPGKIKNERLRKFILLIGLIVSLIAVIGRLMGY